LFESQNKTKGQVKKLLENISICTSITAALSPANAAGILTEWDEFKAFDWKNFLEKRDETYRIFDGRNLVNHKVSHKIFSIGN
jgi:UDPglucose 6-dehydrogenase